MPEESDPGGADPHGQDAALDQLQAPGACAPRPALRGFVRRQGAELTLDGLPFRVGGTNLYYLQQLFAYAERGERDAEATALEALEGVVCMGLPMVRIWAFNEAQDRSAIRTGPDRFSEVGLRGLDRAVAEAKARGIRLILTLTNNWPEYGGLPAMAAWIGRSKDDFFFDRRFQALWTAYVDLLAERVNVYTGLRYRDEPAIVAWELGNEFRCPRCAGSTALVDTLNFLAAYAKAAFPNHLVADGGEGFDDEPSLYPALTNSYPVSGSLGASFHRLASLEALDLVSYHFYPRAWGLDPGFDATVWIERHEALARAVDKVAYLGEYGLSAGGDSPTDDVRAAVYDRWLERLFASTGGLMGFFWQLLPPGRNNGDGHGVTYQSDGHTIGVVQKWVRTTR